MKWKPASSTGQRPPPEEVAFLLLKGFGFKEIATFRDTSEKTARAQSNSVYAKAGLSGRTELAAIFLEDLMAPLASREGAGLN